MKYNKGFAPIVILISILVAGAIGGVAYYTGKSSSKIKTNNPTNYQTINQNNPPVSNPLSQTPPKTSNQAQGRAVLTQAQAEVLVHQTWSDCSQGDCSGVTVSVAQNSSGQYVVTAIFTELDDSTSQTKRVSIATYQNGTWMLGQPIVTRACHRGNVDGTTGWTAGLCI